MRPSMSWRNLWTTVFALLSAAMMGLAAGAVWMVATLFMRHPLPWLALPVGALLAWTIRAGVLAGGGPAALLAALSTLLSAIYVNVLIAGAELAGNMNLGLVDAMRTAGTAMLWNLARLSLHPADAGWTLAGMLLAAWLGWRPRSRRRMPLP
jgi:vitamin B12 transport system permease protein